MNTRTILCDVDQVVADLWTEWFYRFRRRTGVSFYPKDHTSWDFSMLDSYEQKMLFGVLDQPTLYQRVLPVEGALEGVDELRAEGHRVVFVTSSNDSTAGQKMRWLEEHRFIEPHPCYPDVIIAHDKSLVRGDLLIDDAIHNCTGFPAPSILFDQPHNQDLDHPYRVVSWEEIPALVREII